MRFYKEELENLDKYYEFVIKHFNELAEKDLITVSHLRNGDAIIHNLNTNASYANYKKAVQHFIKFFDLDKDYNTETMHKIFDLAGYKFKVYDVVESIIHHKLNGGIDEIYKVKYKLTGIERNKIIHLQSKTENQKNNLKTY